MSVKVIAELSPYSSEKTALEAEPGTIRDILGSLNTGFPPSQARVSHNGGIARDLSAWARDGDTLWVKFVPYGSNEEAGGWMKGGGHLLIGVGVLIAALGSWTGAGAFFGVALIGAGLGLISGGTVLLNTEVPSLKDFDKPDADPSIRGSRNQARPYGRIPVLFGRHRVYPDIAANPHTEVVGNQQYLVQLFCGGYRDCAIDPGSLKLGDIPIADLSHTKDIQKILSHADPAIDIEIIQNGKPSDIYLYCVHEDVLNAPLQKEAKDADGNSISGEITSITPDKTNEINVDIFFHNGLGKYDGEGKLVSASVEINAWYKGKDGREHPLGHFNVSGSKLSTMRFQATKKGLPPDRYTVRIERITADSASSKKIDTVHVGSVRSRKYERPIRAEMQSGLTVIAMKAMATAKLSNVLDGFNYVATSRLPVYSGAGSGSLHWLLSAETRNPAAMLLYALRGRAAQQPVDPADIDWPSFENFYGWCDKHNYTCNAYLSEPVTVSELIRMIGGTARADILRIDSKISVVQDIERPSPMQLFTPKNTVAYGVTMLFADVPDAIALRFIDEESGYAHSEARVHNTPDGNPESDREPDTVQKADLWGVTNSEQARRIGMYSYGCIKNRPFVHSIEVDIEYLLCNKGDWVQYAGDVALTGSVQGRIKGTVWLGGACVGIDTDEPVAMSGGRQHAVRIRLSDGSIVLKDAVFSPGLRREKSMTYYPVEGGGGLREPQPGEMYAVGEDNAYYEPQNAILFTEPLRQGSAPKAGDIYAFGVRGYEVIDLVITDVQPGQNLSATLTCVEYSPEIFGVDGDNFVLPEFVNRVTPVSGAVDSGIVNPDSWGSFAVFHDDDGEPGRPSGDGQGGGWYRGQTFRSIWQSSKIAESIDAGEWGPPVRIRAQRGLDDVTPMWLALEPQKKNLQADPAGDVLAGLLPFTSQARLFSWNSVVQGAAYSLVNAPAGVTVNSNGLVTVGANAALADRNNIVVRAEYQGEAYTAALEIAKDRAGFAPRYLGAVNAVPQGSDNEVSIVKGKVGKAWASPGDYVLTLAAGAAWEMGQVWQWAGIKWEHRPAADNADLYVRCFKDGLDVPGLALKTEWFGSVLAALLVAQRGFIEELQSQVIRLSEKGAVYGGGKFKADGEEDPQAPAGAKGFWLGANGEAKLEKATVKGHIEAASGSFTGAINATSGSFTGSVNATSGNFNGTIRGTLDGRNLVSSGSVVSGTTYLLKGNNNLIEINERDPNNSSITNIPLKTIRLFATGTCTVRVKFPMFDRYAGFYAIRVNGNFVNLSPNSIMEDNKWAFVLDPNGSITSDTRNHIISLSNLTEGNVIELYLKNQDSIQSIYRVVNTTFELRCGGSTPPGLIGLLG